MTKWALTPLAKLLFQLHDNDLMDQDWVKAGIEAAENPTKIVDLTPSPAFGGGCADCDYGNIDGCAFCGDPAPIRFFHWPVHRPGPAWEAPIPGTNWYAGCEPDKPRVSPYTGLCEGCGEEACRVCGRSNCPDGCDDD